MLLRLRLYETRQLVRSTHELAGLVRAVKWLVRNQSPPPPKVIEPGQTLNHDPQIFLLILAAVSNNAHHGSLRP